MLDSSPRMGIVDFGRQLIATQDLDPVYVALVATDLDLVRKCRWLMAYWCFYHVGVACWMSEADSTADYWRRMRLAAENVTPSPIGDRWPRAAERRHFRGVKCVQAVDHLSRQDPEQWISELWRSKAPGRNSISADTVINGVQRWPMFGPWIAFKAADMMERCVGWPVVFNDDLGVIYSEPRAALDVLGTLSRTVMPPHWGDLSIRDRWFAVRSSISDLEAPPFDISRYGLVSRRCGPQEAETVCCKWKSHYKGHYWVGKDTHEVRGALDARWGATATTMLVRLSEVLR